MVFWFTNPWSEAQPRYAPPSQTAVEAQKLREANSRTLPQMGDRTGYYVYPDRPEPVRSSNGYLSASTSTLLAASQETLVSTWSGTTAVNSSPVPSVAVLPNNQTAFDTYGQRWLVATFPKCRRVSQKPLPAKAPAPKLLECLVPPKAGQIIRFWWDIRYSVRLLNWNIPNPPRHSTSIFQEHLRVPHIRIIYRNLPYVDDVCRRYPHHVTPGDIFLAVHRRMHENIDDLYWHSLGHQKQTQARVNARANRAEGLAVGRSIKNVDLMGRHVLFLGLTHDPNLVRGRLGRDEPMVFVAEFGEIASG